MARPTYLGCYNDDDDDDDIDLDGLSGFSQIGPYSVSNTRVTDGTAMTPELCGAICALVNFGYSGVQNNFDCYCGNSYGSLDRDLESNCNKPCAGDATKICGGSNRNSVYALTYLASKNTYMMIDQSNQPVKCDLTVHWLGLTRLFVARPSAAPETTAKPLSSQSDWSTATCWRSPTRQPA
ncbi:hypothetical protein BOX15_Mlig009878g1 [Macrostomum lignano]|uniref:WSC domain-containing protein n=1 Tax=Macrostomum lignano TaxID=282301 RepID=A0A267DGL5_9PLAT|nr:hypothetical protein BOX15_Mlig009878g1 [Macrostomum lignano]